MGLILLFVYSCSMKNLDSTKNINHRIIYHNKALIAKVKESFDHNFKCNGFIEFYSERILKKRKIEKDRILISFLNSIFTKEYCKREDFETQIRKLKPNLLSGSKYSLSKGYLGADFNLDKKSKKISIFLYTIEVNCIEDHPHFTTGYFPNIYYLDSFIDKVSFKFDGADLQYGIWKEIILVN